MVEDDVAIRTLFICCKGKDLSIELDRAELLSLSTYSVKIFTIVAFASVYSHSIITSQ